MFTRPRRQASVSSKADLGSEKKRPKSKSSSKTAKVIPDEELKPKVLFKVMKEDINIRNSKKSSTGYIEKIKLDKVINKAVERTSKSNNKSSHLVLSSSQIGQK